MKLQPVAHDLAEIDRSLKSVDRGLDDLLTSLAHGDATPLDIAKFSAFAMRTQLQMQRATLARLDKLASPKRGAR